MILFFITYCETWFFEVSRLEQELEVGLFLFEFGAQFKD
jgi:hypothetical protein